jgi:hypothetical protein
MLNSEEIAKLHAFTARCRSEALIPSHNFKLHLSDLSIKNEIINQLLNNKPFSLSPEQYAYHLVLSKSLYGVEGGLI